MKIDEKTMHRIIEMVKHGNYYLCLGCKEVNDYVVEKELQTVEKVVKVNLEDPIEPQKEVIKEVNETTEFIEYKCLLCGKEIGDIYDLKDSELYIDDGELKCEIVNSLDKIHKKNYVDLYGAMLRYIARKLEEVI